ncbi:MAG: pyridoxamine 5'-phosphate oxidase [Rhodanobacteraceae bacterium]|nr:pyridoxamine 5'-phosphate oxidase [Pseudomonadota bacterium]
MLNQAILRRFQSLLDAAKRSSDPEPTAMSVATLGDDGRVSSRMVLLKSIDERGLYFFTHYDSDKGRQIEVHSQVALTLLWKQVQPPAQVRIEGRAEKISAQESDEYFASRARLSQIGAWASRQSQTLPDRATLEERVARRMREFEGREVPRPPQWGGYRVVPDMVEFWYGHEHRLNERVCWELLDGEWTKRLLYP